MMVLLKLGLLPKKVLLFINSINEGYRLRLFLEAFGIKSAVLNAELPLNSRHHILQVCITHHPIHSAFLQKSLMENFSIHTRFRCREQIGTVHVTKRDVKRLVTSCHC